MLFHGTTGGAANGASGGPTATGGRLWRGVGCAPSGFSGLAALSGAGSSAGALNVAKSKAAPSRRGMVAGASASKAVAAVAIPDNFARPICSYRLTDARSEPIEASQEGKQISQASGAAARVTPEPEELVSIACEGVGDQEVEGSPA